jgi:hypothetical protein
VDASAQELAVARSRAGLAVLRAREAKLREIDAHRRAIFVQESAAARLRAGGYPAEADAVDERAQHARDRLELALQEQAEQAEITRGST